MENAPEDGQAKQELIRKIVELKKREIILDKQIKEFRDAGVEESDMLKIMNTLHEYNIMLDTVQSIFGVLSKLENTTVEDLYKRFNIPNESRR